MAQRVGLIGLGFFGRETLIEAYARVPGAELVALADTDPTRLRASGEEAKARSGGDVATFSDWHELVSSNGVDLVHVATPPHLHEKMVGFAIAAGKHVICEKPLAQDLATAERIGALAGTAGGVTALDHEMRFDPLMRHAQSLAADGLIGEVRMIDITIHQPYVVAPGMPPYFFDWTSLASAGGGMTLGLLSHAVDLAHGYGGALTPLGGAVTCFVDEKPLRASAERRACDADDTAVIFGRFAGGGLLAISATWTDHHGRGIRWEIVGTEETIRFDEEGTCLVGRAGADLIPVVAPSELAPAFAFGDDVELARSTSLVTANRLSSQGPRFAPLVSLAVDDVLTAIEHETSGSFATVADGVAFHRFVEPALRKDFRSA